MNKKIPVGAEGQGVFAEKLRQAGIKVLDAEDVKEK